MFSSKKRAAIKSMHQEAKKLEKPYVRLCADVLVNHGCSFEEVARSAAIASEVDEVFFIGTYEYLFFPLVKEYLQMKQFPYTFFQVDGLKKKTGVNIGIWLTKGDLDVLVPSDYETTFSDVSVIDVCRPAKWKEIERELQPGDLNVQRLMAEQFEREDPVLLKIVYQASFDRYIPQFGPPGYMIIPPGMINAYGGKANIPDWYRQLSAEARKPGHVRYFHESLRSRFF